MPYEIFPGCEMPYGSVTGCPSQPWILTHPCPYVLGTMATTGGLSDHSSDTQTQFPGLVLITRAFGTGQDPSTASGPSVKLGFTERRSSPRQPLHGSYLGTGKEWAPLLLGTTVLDLLLPDRQMSIFTQSGNHRTARDPPKPSLLFRPLQGRLCLR